MTNNNQFSEPVYYVTVITNFAKGYDKYQRTYSKSGIPESSYPNHFYLLCEQELNIGINKASKLLHKLNLPNNRLIALRSLVPTAILKDNTDTGLGRFIESSFIKVDAVFSIEFEDNLKWHLFPLVIEEAYSESLKLLYPSLIPYEKLRPRTISLLPIAKACQAACPFCFSETSVSIEQSQSTLDLNRINFILQEGKRRGVERVVITGGGEPGILSSSALKQMIKLSADNIDKIVLITNGFHLGKLDEKKRMQALIELAESGLSTLAISRHHWDSKINQSILNLDNSTDAIVRTWMENRYIFPKLKLRLICVLQKGGVKDIPSMASYLNWASNLGIEEVCFKELYVSTKLESVYYNSKANDWSYQHQTPLSVVMEFVKQYDFVLETKLPWGAPIFQGKWNSQQLKIAAYTEPSLFWELSNGIARSWNIMSDGRCLASLEDQASELVFANN